VSSEIKAILKDACMTYVDARISRFNATMQELEDALKPESRSCMGDKYETSRAMLHLEFEKLSGQVEQFNALRRTVSMIDPTVKNDLTVFASVVKTTISNYFISIPAGEIFAKENKYYAVGINSPVAISLLGKKSGDEFSVNGRSGKIISVE
jgi:transcription elongation GreA/GreB family factor